MLDRIQSLDKAILLPLNRFFSLHGKNISNFLAQYLIYSLPIILVILWFWSKQAKTVALRAVFSVVLAWPIMAGVIGSLINRPRPFEVSGVQELLFHRPTYSFPSDHAAALFAVGFSFWFSGYRKLSVAILILAIVVSFFRVATAIHWPTDIIAGAVLGLVAAYLIYLFDKPLSIVYSFIVSIAAKLRLA